MLRTLLERSHLRIGLRAELENGESLFWVSWSYGEDEDEDEDWSCWGLGWGSSSDEYPHSTRQIFMSSITKGQKSRSDLKSKSLGFLGYKNWKYCIHPTYLPHSKRSKKKKRLRYQVCPAMLHASESLAANHRVYISRGDFLSWETRWSYRYVMFVYLEEAKKGGGCCCPTT